ncbi:Retinoic acid induced 16-like protein-domain-containing protein [Halteromyces radiatus]|uniref:Retinoic acid induced 16-like protein-domain-containing protein n=1 Tax=Halteromyces radiatus TaxID=101107 RepID=UPI00221FE619|nr:Retinoic acid induced 16-like protein-domain-containing protein [Halteromyces radiatus]KAI8079793.1 Retinoic acid induced 16-like protein-domain-containing protein [Halteromyces radiatus]
MMDYFNYFTKLTKKIAPPKVQPTRTMQLDKFRKCWDYVHNILRMEDRKSKLHVEQTDIPAQLRQMVDMLVDEEARQEQNTTEVCMEYFLKTGVLQYLVNMSEKMDYPEGIRGEAIRTIASMVDLLDERFLVHNAVHRPTIKLLRFCVLEEGQSDIYHEDLVDLMYIICSKIHGLPALLNIFFHDKRWLTTPQKTLQQPETDTTTHSADKKPEYEFLLFSYLLRFVHLEGRSGDFARTGLLFLIEMATGQLGEFILVSDFANTVAAGLGALYSQLPRKLVIKDDAGLSPNVATYLLGQDLDPRAMPSGPGVVFSNSADFKLQLDSFLKLIEFCQDVLMRCPNTDISQVLLQSIRTNFLKNILDPSIWECSDIDGSSVAVITYIDLILQTLQQEELADVVVKFLMDEENTQDSTVTTKDDDTNVFAGVESDQFKSSPYFTASGRFTLKDLIITRLKASSQPTVIATLKLLRTLITKHCRYSLRLFSIYPDNYSMPSLDDTTITPPSSSATIVSHHIREIELYLSLITAIDQEHSHDILSVGYEGYLNDIEYHMEADWCYQNMICMDSCIKTEPQQTTTKAERRRSSKYGKRPDQKEQQQQQQQLRQHSSLCTKSHMFRHRIRPTDDLLQILLGLLSHFFAQSSALNLALTGVISALAQCPYRSLEGWISFQESDRATPDDILILDASNLTNGTATTTTTTTTATTSASSLLSTSDQLNNKNHIRGDDIYAHFEYSQVDENDEDDDRSVDFGVERNLSHTAPTTQFKSFPPFFTLFRTLTQQVDYYRSEVDSYRLEVGSFDDILTERWQTLMYGELIDPTTTTMSNTTATNGTSGISSPASRRGSTVRQDMTSSSLLFSTTPTSSIPTTTTMSTNAMMNGNNDGFYRSSRSPSTPASTLFHQQQRRRPSISAAAAAAAAAGRQQPSQQQRLLPPPNPSKSLSSSTTAAAMAAATRVTPTPLSSPPTPILHPSQTSSIMSNSEDTMTTATSSITTTVSSSSIATTTATDLPAALVNHEHSRMGMHIRKTLHFRLDPLFPSNFVLDPEAPILYLDEEDEGAFVPKDDSAHPSEQGRRRRRFDPSSKISLSMLLNNIVILEETIKELVAIMQVRRAIGIDRVSYL